MHNGRIMTLIAHCPTCADDIITTATVRYANDGTAAAHGTCACGTRVMRPVLGGHLPLRPVCASCAPSPSPTRAHALPAKAGDTYRLDLPTVPGNPTWPADLSAAVRDVAALLADNAGHNNASMYAPLAATIVEGVFGHVAATAFHAAEAWFIEHRKQPFMGWGHDASKILRDWAWEYEATLPEHVDR
ncbi:hypothetical protein LO763_22600 [Glycomyces sp. A-F 0318]|uniref:hypothetical protein n=1 Tax=Glycomyces amatae TaxID=2881355 RepID=UPI001E4C5AF3|nr:hypothetical protein [Glycomyces amatae]MCD0446410.1 hypothetical protein [Glycomyces amatae]